MSNSNDIRSDLGLVNLVRNLMGARRICPGLHKDMTDAVAAYETNLQNERKIRTELANHIREVGHNEIIILPEIAVHISLRPGADQATMDFIKPRS